MWLSRVGRWSATATRTTVTRPTSAAALRTTVTLTATRRHLFTAASTQHASTRTKVSKSPFPPVEIVNKPIYDVYVEATEKHIKHAFGLSELGLASHMPMCDDPKGYIHCEALASNMEMKIIDQNSGAELGDGEVGEVCIRSPGQMSGYLNNRKATEETIVDGWIHTGYIGYSNEKSQLFIVDRKKKLINVKGLQVDLAMKANESEMKDRGKLFLILLCSGMTLFLFGTMQILSLAAIEKKNCGPDRK